MVVLARDGSTGTYQPVGWQTPSTRDSIFEKDSLLLALVCTCVDTVIDLNMFCACPAGCPRGAAAAAEGQAPAGNTHSAHECKRCAASPLTTYMDAA
jgi:hypothetical protein